MVYLINNSYVNHHILNLFRYNFYYSLSFYLLGSLDSPHNLHNLHPGILQSSHIRQVVNDAHAQYIKYSNSSVEGGTVVAAPSQSSHPISPLQRHLAAVHVSGSNGFHYTQHPHSMGMHTPPSTPDNNRKGKNHTESLQLSDSKMTFISDVSFFSRYRT